MDPLLEQIPQVLELYLQISQYPILAHSIRERMRKELFARGVISPDLFEEEVREKAITSQKREGIEDPFGQEAPWIWQERLSQIRDYLTDFYFAYNLPHALFEEIIHDVLDERAPDHDALPFNPELAPQNVLLAQAKRYANLAPKKQTEVHHHLREIIVVLTKSMISDQMGFVRLAKQYLDPKDFETINNQRIGRGKIGGKAAGMLLAWKILQEEDPNDQLDLSKRVVIPDTYFIGADMFYNFHTHNNLDEFINQKYKTEEQIRADYPRIQKTYMHAKFPDKATRHLRQLLSEVGKKPLIVRSSSLLEDNFGFSFAGKYDSFFCPNQGTPQENLQALTTAIRRVYASVFGPNALLYRRRMGLVDYDERMAIMIQEVQGKRYGNYFFPTLAGVGFSHNPFRWNRRIQPKAGLLRLVCGLGTRAVDRVANDYPRMVALSHPPLRPEASAYEIRKYSQHYIDVIDLRANELKTLPVRQVIDLDYPDIRLLASQDKGDYLQPIYATGITADQNPLVITFNQLLKDQAFVTLMRNVLRKLELRYERPVDIEFTVEIRKDEPRFVLHLLQCRPQSSRKGGESIYVPVEKVPEESIIFLARRMVPHGKISRIRYIVYVDPRQYDHVPDYTTRYELARVIGRLNKKLEDERFILMGPGRWGTNNVELGLKVGYADIYNTQALIEIALKGSKGVPEVSYGTHFFQDLVEAQIYPLPLYPDDPETIFNRDFFDDAPNSLANLLPKDAEHANYIQVIDIPAYTDGRYLELAMDSKQDEALAYLKWYPQSHVE